MVKAFIQGRDVFAMLPTGYLWLFFKANYGYLAKWLFLITVGTAIMNTSLHSCSTNRMTSDPRACVLEGVASPETRCVTGLRTRRRRGFARLYRTVSVVY